MRYLPHDRRDRVYPDSIAKSVAMLYLEMAKGDPRDAKLRAACMWYSPEFIQSVQRFIDNRRSLEWHQRRHK